MRQLCTGGLLVLLLIHQNAFAHGEDKPGPNGGYIRMPGGFHTELVKVSSKKFKIFLLDINWKNPIVSNSSVEATLTTKKNELPIACEAKSSFFECTLSKGSSLKTAKIITIRAARDALTAAPAIYELPLRF